VKNKNISSKSSTHYLNEIIFDKQKHPSLGRLERMKKGLHNKELLLETLNLIAWLGRG
jgi:hypothetical protein